MKNILLLPASAWAAQVQAIYRLDCYVWSVLRLVHEPLTRGVIGQASAKKSDYQNPLLIKNNLKLL